LRLHLQLDKLKHLVKLVSVRSLGIMWVPNNRSGAVPKTVLAAASWSRQWSLERRWRDDVRNWSTDSDK